MNSRSLVGPTSMGEFYIEVMKKTENQMAAILNQPH